MAFDLGGSAIVGSLDLDISKLTSKADQAAASVEKLDGAGANAFSQAESRATSFGDKLDALGGKMMKLGGFMTAGVTLPVIGAFGKIFTSAADLEQTVGATEKIFGESAGAILDWSEDAAGAFGMTQDQALTSVNNFNAMFKQLNAGQDVVTDMSQAFVGLSADLSAMWGGSSLDASQRLTSALRGNYEGLDQYNINLTEAMVSQEAMNVALADGREEITEADKVQARYNLIMEQTTDAQGQFAAEAGTASGALAIFRAEAGNAAAGIGRLLLPIGTKAAKMLTDLVKRIDGLTDTQKKWVLGIAAVVAGIGPLMTGLGFLVSNITTLGAVIGFLLSPIGLLVAAGGVLAFLFRDEIGSAIQAVIGFVGDLIEGWQMLGDGMNPIERGLRAIQIALAMIGGENTPEWIAAVARSFGNLANAFAAFQAGNYAEMWGQIWAAILNVGSAFANLAATVLSWTLTVGVPAIAGWVVDVAGDVWGGIKSLAGWVWDNRAEIGTILLNFGWGIVAGIQSAWDWIKGWIFGDGGGSGLPGDGTGGAAYGSPIDLGSILLNVAGWLKGEWPDVQLFLKEKIGDPLRHAVDLALDVDNLSMGGIKDFEDAVAGIRADWERIQALVGVVRDADLSMGGIRDFEDVVGGIKADWDRIQSVATWIRDSFSLGNISTFEDAVEGIKNDWDRIQSAIGSISSMADFPGISSVSELTEGIKNDWQTIKSIWDAIFGGGADKGSSNTGKADDAEWGHNQGGTGTGGVGGSGGVIVGGGGGWAEDDLSGMPVVFDNIAAAAGRAAAAILPIPANLGAVAAQSPALQSFGSNAQSSFTMAGVAAAIGLTPIPTLAGTAAGALTGVAIPAMLGTAASAGTSFGQMLGSAVSNFTGMNTTGTTNSAGMRASVTAAISGMVSTAGSQLGTMASTAVGNFITMRSNAQSAGSGIAQAITSGTATAVSNAGSNLGRLAGTVASAGANAASNAWSAGSNIGNSLASGLESAYARVAAAGAALADAAANAIALAAQIKSPSKVGIWLGQMIGIGPAIGIEDMIPRVVQSVENMMGSVRSAFDPRALSFNTAALAGSGYTPAYAYAAATAAPVVQHHYHDNRQFFALEQGAYGRLVDQAERGGTYARTMEQPDAYTQWLGGN
jgi:hypothetical protein